ncbi:hypothetical protein [Nocardia sp.]|uniref:hypothetical protein n=1 Tax=Nocardia sp. TaxID=1821 RepID=UPI002636B0A1|nr:hypothetical protein [Nocardia sp.]
MRIALEDSTLVRAARAELRVTPEDLAALESVMSGWSPALTSTLATLSPDEIARARSAVTRAVTIGKRQSHSSRAEIVNQVAEAKEQLAQALSQAHRRIDTASAESTAQAVVASGQQLGYRVTRRREGCTTAIDMRRDHEIVLAVVRGGTIALDHAGLADATCLRRHSELFDEIGSRGVELVEVGRDDHRDDSGGQLIRAAVGDHPELLGDPGAFALSAARQIEHTSPQPEAWNYTTEAELEGPRIQA